MPIMTRPIEYKDGNTTCVGVLAWNEEIADPKPCILISHAWGGLDSFAQDKAVEMAAMGYVGFALDNYGGGQTPDTVEGKQALMNPLVGDRAKLLKRLQAGYKAAAKLDEVDEKAMGMMGFCFGGLCTLDMARSGANLHAAISFHGLLGGHDLPKKKCKASVLIAHGWDDPMAPPEDVTAVMHELTEAGADVQLMAFSNTTHAFMVPGTDAPDMGLQYNEDSARRAWMQCLELLEEKFARHGVS
jgi:dienelactone hydrolase